MFALEACFRSAVYGELGVHRVAKASSEAADVLRYLPAQSGLTTKDSRIFLRHEALDHAHSSMTTTKMASSRTKVSIDLCSQNSNAQSEYIYVFCQQIWEGSDVPQEVVSPNGFAASLIFQR